jgi:transposase-like protein
MKKRRTDVPRELKERITLASLEPGCDLVSLARKYKLARTTISRWRKIYRQQHSENILTKPDQQFIELKLAPQEKVSTLKKVELLFDNHRCCIEGKLGSAQLLKLVELFEEVAC